MDIFIRVCERFRGVFLDISGRGFMGCLFGVFAGDCFFREYLFGFFGVFARGCLIVYFGSFCGSLLFTMNFANSPPTPPHKKNWDPS